MSGSSATMTERLSAGSAVSAGLLAAGSVPFRQTADTPLEAAIGRYAAQTDAAPPRL